MAYIINAVNANLAQCLQFSSPLPVQWAVEREHTIVKNLLPKKETYDLKRIKKELAPHSVHHTKCSIEIKQQEPIEPTDFDRVVVRGYKKPGTPLSGFQIKIRVSEPESPEDVPEGWKMTSTTCAELNMDDLTGNAVYNYVRTTNIGKKEKQFLMWFNFKGNHSHTRLVYKDGVFRIHYELEENSSNNIINDDFKTIIDVDTAMSEISSFEKLLNEIDEEKLIV